jgi:hypothetical protein
MDMTSAPIRMLGKTTVKRLAGLKPGVVPASIAAVTAGAAVGVVTYRLLRSH